MPKMPNENFLITTQYRPISPVLFAGILVPSRWSPNHDHPVFMSVGGNKKDRELSLHDITWNQFWSCICSSKRLALYLIKHSRVFFTLFLNFSRLGKESTLKGLTAQDFRLRLFSRLRRNMSWRHASCLGFISRCTSCVYFKYDFFCLRRIFVFIFTTRSQY